MFNRNFLIKLVSLAAVAIILPTAILAFVQKAKVLTYPASNVTANSAFLRGTVTDDGGCLEFEQWFELGTLPRHYTIKTPIKLSNRIGDFGDIINGLNPCVTYYYIAVTKNNSGRAGYGDESIFVTGGCASLPVIVPSGTPTTTSNGNQGNVVDTSLATRIGTGRAASLAGSALLPTGLTLLILWVFRSKIVGLDKWTGERKKAIGEYRAKKLLARKIRAAKRA